MQDKLKQITKSRLFWPLAALVLVLIFNIIFVDDFLKIELKDGNFYGRIIDIINRAGALMLLAIGMTLVVATGGIDISVGSVSAISGAIAATIIGGKVDGAAQNPMTLAILAALLVTVVTGMWNGFLVAKLKIQPVVATLILLTAGRGIAQLVTDGQIITVYYKPFSYIGGFLPGLPIPFSIVIVAIVLTIVMIAIKKTALGLFIEAAGINELASKFAGINVTRIKFLVYTFCGLCAGIAGLILGSMIKAADSNNAGLFMEMDAILAVAMGGTSLNGGKFSVMASVIGALIIQSLYTTMYAIGVSPEVLPVVKAFVVILICLFQAEEFRKLFAKMLPKRGGAGNEKTAVKL